MVARKRVLRLRSQTGAVSALAAAAALALALAATRADAQVVLDGKLGPGGALEGPNFVIDSGLGRVRGGNLFHSFSRFNINGGESVTFTSSEAAPINNVLARVTGGEASNISGLLRCDIDGANFYLINPAGVVFGPGAQLDVKGSFAATTANHVRLSDGVRFGLATDDGLLTAAAPAAFGFLSPSPAVITVAGAGTEQALAVPAGKSLTLAGGPVRISGARIEATGGQVSIVSAASAGEVRLDPSAAQPAIDVSGLPKRGPVEIRDRSTVVTATDGRIVIRGGDMTLDGSSLGANTDVVPGGGIDIDLTGGVTMQNGALASQTTGPAPGGAIRVTAESISVRGLTVNDAAPTPIRADSGPAAVAGGPTGNGGSITLKAETITFAADAAATAFAFSSGNGGNIDITATRSLTIDGTGSSRLTGFATEALDDATGNAGSVTVHAGRVAMFSTGEMTSTTKGAGAAGDLAVTAKSVLIDGRNPAPTLLNGQLVQPLTGLEARVGQRSDLTGASGPGGTITIKANDLRLARGGAVTASTLGSGAGGNIDVQAGQVRITGSSGSQFTGLFARSAPALNVTTPGRGGNVTVRADDVRVSGPASVSAEATAGDAGNVSVTVRHTLVMTGDRPPTRRDVDQGTGQVAAKAAGNGGNVTVVAGQSVYMRDAVMTARAGTAAQPGDDVRGGRILIDPPAVALDGSFIDARSGGTPVKVDITSAGFLRSNSQVLTDRVIDLPESDIAGALLPLRADVVGGAAQLVPNCGLLFSGSNISSFVVTGRGGVPAAAGGWRPDWSLDSILEPPPGR